MYTGKELKQEVIEMIKIVQISEIGLLKAFRMALIETQANYYYAQSKQLDRMIELRTIELDEYHKKH